jgi:CheY-like chemotaxis protein
LINLIDNALKFTEKGSIEVNVNMVQKTESNIEIKFSVKDTGIGISKDEQERIFDRFEQAKTDTSRKFGGSGLGLAIIRNLLRLQGTDIQVNSTIRKGSEFYFKLGFGISLTKDSDTTDLTKFKEKRASESPAVHILLVEDNEMNMKVAKRFLERWDYDIDTAENGLEALKKYKTKTSDLILMDLHMPEMDGWAATKAIRESNKSRSKEVPIIALTADVMVEDLDKLYDIGMNDYITKPFKADELKSKIQKFLNV